MDLGVMSKNRNATFQKSLNLKPYHQMQVVSNPEQYFYLTHRRYSNWYPHWSQSGDGSTDNEEVFCRQKALKLEPNHQMLYRVKTSIVWLIDGTLICISTKRYTLLPEVLELGGRYILVLWHINHNGSFNAKHNLYMYTIRIIWKQIVHR